MLTDLVLGDLMPDREQKILALIHLLPEQGVEFGVSPLLGEEVGRHDNGPFELKRGALRLVS